MSFIHDNFLLETKTAERLYHKYASSQPIIDYHCHLPPKDVAAAKGVSQVQLARRLTPLLPANSQLKTSDEQAQQGAKQVSSGLSSVRTFLLVFGGIALFVGAFVIFNTISITVAQRARELATLRTLGASRRRPRMRA